MIHSEKYGEYKLFTTDYKRFRADKEENRNHKADSTVEYLHCLIKQSRWVKDGFAVMNIRVFVPFSSPQGFDPDAVVKEIRDMFEYSEDE